MSNSLDPSQANILLGLICVQTGKVISSCHHSRQRVEQYLFLLTNICYDGNLSNLWRPDTLAHSEDPDEMLLNAFITHPEPRLSKELLHTAS